MIEAGIGGSPVTYQRLMQSPNWVPFYDDGRIVMFGRADAPASDLAFFKANRLDPDLRAFRDGPSGARRRASAQPDLDDRRDLPDSDPQPAALANRIGAAVAQSRKRRRSGRDGRARRRLPEPARCLLAIQEARRRSRTVQTIGSLTASSTKPIATS